MFNNLLDQKVALITGATSGIGRATARLFVASGARVAFTGRRADLGRALEEEIGGYYIPADHRVSDDCRRSVEQAITRFGRIDILFNNAGVVVKGRAEDMSEEDWFATLDLNVTGVWRMSKLVIPIMRAQRSGVIVNNASDWGVVGGREAVAYSASKGAVIQMTRSMALDHAKENIRINAVCPGDTFVERWVQSGYYKDGLPVDEATARINHEIPMGRVGEVEEVAQAVLFLASDLSGFITGTTLLVDGGNTAQ